jgi:hypothetical protein
MYSSEDLNLHSYQDDPVLGCYVKGRTVLFLTQGTSKTDSGSERGVWYRCTTYRSTTDIVTLF